MLVDISARGRSIKNVYLVAGPLCGGGVGGYRGVNSRPLKEKEILLEEKEIFLIFHEVLVISY